MVQHLELSGDCAFLDWYGGNDFTSYIAQRHCKIQPNGLWRRCSGRFRMEVGPW